MALRLVRQTSDTPNITNKDDTVMTRYAYGGYNGVVKSFGSECGYTAENGIFKVLDGRIVVDGWEIDVDGAGWNLDFSKITGTQYHSVYVEINVLTENASISSTYLTGSYPEIEKGDDLTEIPNGTARLLLYNLIVVDGNIVDVEKRFEIIPYLEQIGKSLFNKNNAVAVQRARNFDKNKDENGEYGELYLRFAQIGISNYQGTKAIAPLNGYNKDKGTIEERLTKLGFKSGVINFLGDNYGSENYINATQNGIYRVGNFVICHVGTIQSNKGSYLKKGATIFTLPANFRPKYTITIDLNAMAAPSVALYMRVNIDKNGNGVVKSFAYGSITESTNVEFTYNLNFGFEAPPIT